MGGRVASEAAEAPIQIAERGVPVRNGGVGALASSLDWEDLRAFLLVVESGGLRRAAARSRASVNTLRRRVARLEERTGSTLLARGGTGSTPTEAGIALAEAAREMRIAAAAGAAERADDVLVRRGELRIGCTEGLGSLWLTPRLEALGDRLDGLTVSLQLDYDVARDRSAEVDVGLSFARPVGPDLVCARLATIHYALFASAGYLRRRGQMASLDDYRDHTFVEQSGAGLSPGLIDVLVGPDRPPGFLPIRSNSALSVYWAVASGAGIAALPTYARVVAPALVPIEARIPLRFELWFYYRATARRSTAIRAAVDWLREAFDPVDNPWFADGFLAPVDFPPEREGNVVPLFAGLFGGIGRNA